MAVRFAVVLAVLGSAAVAVGVGLAYLPAGVIVGGLEMLASAYAVAYLMARREAKGAP